MKTRKNKDVIAETDQSTSKNELNSVDIENNFYENIVDTVREPLLILDKDLRVVKAGKSFLDFFKVSSEETIGKLIYDLGNKQWNIPKLRELLETILPEKTVFDNFEVQHDFLTIGKRIMLLNARKIETAFGKEKIILLAIEDVTERKQLEESLSEKSRMTSEYLDILVNHAHFPIIIWDASFVITRFNNSFEKLTGYDTSEVMGKNIDFLFPQNKRESTLKLLENSLHEEKFEIIEIDILRKDKGIRTVLWNSANVFDKEGRIVIATVAQDINERKRVEDALKESEEIFNHFMEKSPYYVFFKDKNIRSLRLSSNYEQMLGKPLNSILGKTMDELFPSELAKKMIEVDKEILNRRETVIVEEEFNGKYFTTIKFPIIINDMPKYLAGFTIDITERKQAEEELQKLSRAVEQSPASIIITDTEGNIEYINPKVTEITGYQSAEVIGKNPRIFSSGAKSKIEYKELWETITSGKEWRGEIHNKKKNGELYWEAASISPIINDKGIITNYLAVKEDITEKKLAEDKIMLLAHALKSINECVSITDIEDKIIFVNESFLKTYGYEENELLGKNIDLVQSEKNSPDFIKEILPSTLQGEWNGELWNKRKDGSEFQIYLSTTSIYDKENTILGLIGVAKDVTEFKLNQKELINAKEKAEESDKMKSEFLAQMSHEIRTPINAMLGYIDYLNDLFGKPKDPDAIECFKGIDLTSKRIIRTIDLILNAAELQTGNYQPHFNQIDLDKEILNKLYNERSLSASQRGIELIYNCQLNDPMILADNYSTTQIFVNLIDNAIKYTKKGKVEILLTKNITGNTTVEIRDTGIGIAKEFLPKLFNAFAQEEQGYSRSFEGNGLGLAIVRSYCDVNNARIEVESVKNVGSTFRVIFDKIFIVNTN